jgi:hypothetical protein
MGKRFIDTGLFDDPWFMDLSKDGKIGWMYLLTKCDHAGIIEINEKLFKVMTGINSLETVIKELGNRIIYLRDSYFFIPKFIQYQYPDFPKSNVKAQFGAIKRLREFYLYDEENSKIIGDLANSYQTVSKELNNSYGYGYGYGYENGIKEPTKKKERKIEFNEISEFYLAQVEAAKKILEEHPEAKDVVENYKNFVLTIYDWKNKDIKDAAGQPLHNPMTNILKIERQLRFDQFAKLWNEARKNGIDFYDKLNAIDNKKGYADKVVDLNKTLMNWIKPYNK